MHHTRMPRCPSIARDGSILTRDQTRMDAKKDFLRRAVDGYGYRSTPDGHIDTWRGREFPHLIPPMLEVRECSDGNNSNTNEASGLSSEPEVYLDYAGAALPSRSQLQSIMSQYTSVGALANPHSKGPAASRTLVLIEQAKKLVLDHFNGHPGKAYGIGNAHEDTRNGGGRADHHPGYEMIFTSGATESLRIVAESFQWGSGKAVDDRGPHTSTICSCPCQYHRERRKSLLLYPHNSHTSVVGMRGPAMAKGGTFRCIPLEELTNATSKDFSEWADECNSPKGEGVAKNQACCNCQYLPPYESESESESDEIINHLMVLPVECNFGGNRPKHVAELIQRARRSSSVERKSEDPKKSRWNILLDVAKAASTGPVDLRQLDPDFACLSFYKIFGEPTGLGVLFVKRSSLHLLGEAQTGERRNGTNRYFGGGSVDVVLASKNFVSPRSEPSPISSFVHGSVHFRGISTLVHGFEELKRIGGMEKISVHSRCLAKEFVKRLRLLRHGNGRPLCIVYGAWSQHPCEDDDLIFIDDSTPGPTVAFNVLRSNGSTVGYSEVSNLAALNKPPIQLRDGCFCNAGACQRALGLTDDQIQDNFLVAGHVCGDKKDVINGRVTGAIRASFGKDSIWEDVDALLSFLASKFTSGEDIMAAKAFGGEERMNVKELPASGLSYFISDMFVFPIKSCAAMPAKRWQMNTSTGSLLYDREFALVDSSGAAMRLHTYPKMSQIAPSIDLERQVLVVSAPGLKDLTISLTLEGRDSTEIIDASKAAGHIWVCGSRACASVWGSDEVTEWFSSFLGVQCWLVRHKSERHRALDYHDEDVSRTKAFANDAALLLVSQNSIDHLNGILAEQHSKLVTSRHFRPNLVVKSQNALAESSRSKYVLYPEDSWSRVELLDQGVALVSGGLCARCQMVDVDPTSGMKGKTLRALSEYRRRGGQIVFGIFLSMSTTNDSPFRQEKVWIQAGDTLQSTVADREIEALLKYAAQLEAKVEASADFNPSISESVAQSVEEDTNQQLLSRIADIYARVAEIKKQQQEPQGQGPTYDDEDVAHAFLDYAIASKRAGRMLDCAKALIRRMKLTQSTFYTDAVRLLGLEVDTIVDILDFKAGNGLEVEEICQRGMFAADVFANETMEDSPFGEAKNKYCPSDEARNHGRAARKVFDKYQYTLKRCTKYLCPYIDNRGRAISENRIFSASSFFNHRHDAYESLVLDGNIGNVSDDGLQMLVLLFLFGLSIPVEVVIGAVDIQEVDVLMKAGLLRQSPARSSDIVAEVQVFPICPADLFADLEERSKDRKDSTCLFVTDFPLESMRLPRNAVMPIGYDTLELLSLSADGRNSGRILDICCGCGIQGIFAWKASQMGQPRVKSSLTLTDINGRAVYFATANLALNNVLQEAQAHVVCNDLFEGLDKNSKFDCIVSNPPFVAVPAFSTPQLQPALYAVGGGTDGMDLLRRLFASCLSFLACTETSTLLMVTEVPNVEHSCEMVECFLSKEYRDTVEIGITYVEDDVETVDSYSRVRESEAGLDFSRDWTSAMAKDDIYNRALVLISLRHKSEGGNGGGNGLYCFRGDEKDEEENREHAADEEDAFLTRQGVSFVRESLLG